MFRNFFVLNENKNFLDSSMKVVSIYLRGPVHISDRSFGQSELALPIRGRKKNMAALLKIVFIGGE